MQLIEQYIISMARLYGFFEIEALVELYNKHNETPISEDTVHTIPGLYARLEKQFVYYEEGTFISQALYPDEYFFDLLGKKREKHTYIPGKEELLNYQNEAYFNPSEALDEWIRFIRRNGNELALIEFDEVLMNSLTALRMGWSAEGVLKDMAEQGYHIEARLHKQAIRILKKVKRNLRMWEYNGHTLEEVRAMNKKKSTNKPGRNDPCPCGSGKKYKHCCLNK